MSTPRSLQLPDGARATTLDSPFGPVAALRIEPARPSGRAPVLLLPGFTGSKEDFLALLEPLAAAGFPVIAVDQRGQFETVGAEEITPDGYPLEEFAREAVAITEAIGGPLHLVGHSFGGLVAQAMTLLAPEQVRSLTLLCSGPAALPEDQRGDLGTFINGLPIVGKETAWAVMREQNAATRGPATPEVEEFVRRRFVANAAGSLVGIARILGTAPDRVDELAALDVPAQIVHGENDDAWPLHEQRATAERLGAPVHVIADAGHSPNVDDPAATAAVLTSFFSSVEISGASRES